MLPLKQKKEVCGSRSLKHLPVHDWYLVEEKEGTHTTATARFQQGVRDIIVKSKLNTKLPGLEFSRSVIQWFWSYFCGKSQCIFSKTSSFLYRDINLGVMQGSVLGPLLESLHINDQAQHLGNDVTLRLLYADDLCPNACLTDGMRYRPSIRVN